MRLIAPDRPGIGRSEPQADRSISEWGTDVAALVDALNPDAYSIVGYSAGGPYALACAADSQGDDRLEAVGLLGGVGPPAAPRGDMQATNRIVFAASRLVPWVLEPAFGLQVRLVDRRPPSFVTQLYSERDIGSLSDQIDPEVAETVKRDFMETFAAGAEGVAHESVLLTRPWEFELSAVEVPVVCRYGGADRNVPPAHGEYVAEKVPTGELTIVPDTDHLGLLTEQGGRLLSAVAR